MYWVPLMLLTSLLQSHHGGLLDQISLDEAPEVLAVDAEVRQLECINGHLQRELLAGTLISYLQPCQGDDSRAGMGDPAGQTLLCRGARGGIELGELKAEVQEKAAFHEPMVYLPCALSSCFCAHGLSILLTWVGVSRVSGCL